MPNREVNLTKRVNTRQGLATVLSSFLRTAESVLVNGKEERHAKAAYSLEWRNGAKRVCLWVGNDPN